MIFGGSTLAFAVVAVLYLQIRLRHYASKEKVHAVENVAQLWRYGGPPKTVLNEWGLWLRQFGSVTTVTLLIAAGVAGALSILGASPNAGVVPALLAGAALLETFVESRLKHHVSKENVRALDDVSRLWRFGGVPTFVLNEEGLRLNGYRELAAVVFFVGIGLAVFGAIAPFGMPDPEVFG